MGVVIDRMIYEKQPTIEEVTTEKPSKKQKVQLEKLKSLAGLDESKEGLELNGTTKEKKRYGWMTIDDGTAVIRAKAWGEDVSWLEKVDKGSSVVVFGRVGSYQNELYLVPDFVKIVEDPNFELLWDLELLSEELSLKTHHKSSTIKMEHGKSDGLTIAGSNGGRKEISKSLGDTKEKPLTLEVDLTTKILNTIITGGNRETGISQEEILKYCGNVDEERVSSVLEKLVEDGVIYQPRPRFFRKV
jgi:hypothetical protein